MTFASDFILWKKRSPSSGTHNTYYAHPHLIKCLCSCRNSHSYWHTGFGVNVCIELFICVTEGKNEKNETKFYVIRLRLENSNLNLCFTAINSVSFHLSQFSAMHL